MMGISKNSVHGTYYTLKRYIINLKTISHKWAEFWYLALYLNCASKEYEATADGKLRRQGESALGDSKGWKHVGMRFGGIEIAWNAYYLP